jgi:CheY-like chemotaxis protein
LILFLWVFIGVFLVFFFSCSSLIQGADLQMPVMCGIDSSRAIRKLEKQRNTIKGSLIIALTGLAAASDKVEAYAAGIDLFLVKPVSFRQLEKTIGEYKFNENDKD